MKKHWLVLLITVLLGGLIAAGYGLRSYYLFLKQPVAPLTRALPGQTVAFLKSGSIAGFIEKTRSSGLIDILDTPEADSGFSKLASTIDSIAYYDDYLRKLTEENEFLLGFSPDSAGNPALLLVVNVGKINERTFRQHLTGLFKNAGSSANKERLHGTDIHYAGDAGTGIWYYISHGLLVISADKQLMTQSLESMHNPALPATDPALERLTETAGKRVDAVLFFRNSQLFSLLSGTKAEPLLAKGSPFGGWTALDLSLRKDKVQVSGFTWNGESSSILNGQSPEKAVDFDEYPSSALFGFSILLSDPALYTKQFFAGDTMQVTGYDSINQIVTKEIFRPEDHLWPWMGNRISYVVRSAAQPGPDNVLLLIGSKDRESAENALRPFLQSSGDKIAKLLAENLPERLWGPWFGLQGPLYCHIGKNSVAIAHSVPFLNDYIAETEREGSAPDFATLSEDLSEKSNFILFLRPDKLAKIGKTAGRWTSWLSGCDQMAMNFSTGDPMLYAQGSLKFRESLTAAKEPQIKELPEIPETATAEPATTATEVASAATTPEPEPEITSGAALAYTPVIIRGKAPGERQIALITSGNALQMYNSNGGLLWSFNGNGTATGDVYAADYKKNGQLFYLFFTRTHMHILDHNGKEVAESPVTLPGGCKSRVALFDYDRKRDYRVIYAGNNNLIHNITLKGTPLPDWQKPRLDNFSDVAVFYRTGGKDYLTFSSNNGTLLITDRRGRERIKIPASFKKSAPAPLFENKTNSKGIFLTASGDGQLAYISENGTISYSRFAEFGHNPWFDYYDFDGDGSYDFIFAGNGKITIFSRMKNVIASRDLKKSSAGRPFLYTSVAGERWLVARDKNSGHIVAIRSKGQVKEYEKLKSDTDPVIFNPGGRHNELLVTTLKGRLILTPLK